MSAAHIEALSTSTPFAGSYAALIAQTTSDGMDAWKLVLQRPIPEKYEDISFATEREGWIGTAGGDILHTADSGATWNVQASGLGAVRTVDFIDQNRGFAGTLSGTLYATTDGGDTWSDITSRLPKLAKGFCGIAHVGNRVHIVGRYVGRASDYFYSADGGRTWGVSDLGALAQGLVDVTFVDPSIGFIGGMSTSLVVNQGAAVILKTTDGGRSWRSVYKHDGGRGFVWKLFPVSSKLTYAALQSQDGTYRIARTIDGGDNWETRVVATGQPEGIGVQGIGFVDAARGWVGGFFRGMYVTTDSGRTWRHAPTPDARINRFEKVGRAVFTAGSRGILRFDQGQSKPR